jgi:tetratricopeptide (TPR) repeat protein
MNLISLIIFTLFLLQPNSVLANNRIADTLVIEKNTRVIEDLFNQNKEYISINNVMPILNNIIEERHLYPNNTIAKVFILFAEVAKNKIDVDRSFQFTRIGSKLISIELPLKLNLLLKVATQYYLKGQYQEVLTISNEVMTLAKTVGNKKDYLLALAYRSVAHALTDNYFEAFTDLKSVENLIKRNKNFEDNIELLEVTSTAYHYLGDYQSMLTTNQKIIKLRFDSSLTFNLVNNYYHLATAYHHLGLLDDAYNAYWETKRYAKEQQDHVQVAFAELGLGQILLLQKNYQASYLTLSKVEKRFKEENLTKPYLSTLLSLAKVSLLSSKEEFAHQLLKKAEKMMSGIKLTSEQIELYLLLADMYESQENYSQALALLKRYNKLYESFTNNIISSISLRTNDRPGQEKVKALMIKLTDKTELNAIFYKKFQQQQFTVFVMVIAFSIAIFLLILFTVKRRLKKMNIAYGEREKPAYFLESPLQTKQIYQRAYKQARKYNYPMSIGYVSIDNWKELAFRFNKKTLNEVSKTIATLINEHTVEFDYAGLINEGEYLLLYPHQTSSTIEKSFEELKEVLNVRLFANLGGEAVNIHFSLDTPTVQDIDPYIFLSKLRDAAVSADSGVEYSTNKASV